MSVVVSVCGDSARTIYHDAGGRGVEGRFEGLVDAAATCYAHEAG